VEASWSRQAFEAATAAAGLRVSAAQALPTHARGSRRPSGSMGENASTADIGTDCKTLLAM
jgi:hypothetical protein